MSASTRTDHDDPFDIWVPSVDGCCFCGDGECDGLGCIQSLDADNERDHPQIEWLHDLLRAGHAFLHAQRAYASASNQKVPPFGPIDLGRSGGSAESEQPGGVG